MQSQSIPCGRSTNSRTGVAANLLGSVRATKDIEILVPKDEANMSRVLAAFCERPYGIARELNASDIVRNPITIVGDDPRADPLTSAWTVTFDEAWDRRSAPAIPLEPQRPDALVQARAFDPEGAGGGRDVPVRPVERLANRVALGLGACFFER